MDELSHDIYDFMVKMFVIGSPFFVIKNFKSSQPQGCCGLKFSLALNVPHILGCSMGSCSVLNVNRYVFKH